MATVAGIIAEYAIKAMIKNGAKHAIVDNGGDIAIFSNRPVSIGIYTGHQSTSNFAIKISPQNKILGICTSSGNIGHSFSFGNTDAVTVISRDVSLADAAATALGNIVNSENDIKNAFKILANCNKISGAAIFINNKIGLFRDFPEIIHADVPYELITRGR